MQANSFRRQAPLSPLPIDAAATVRRIAVDRMRQSVQVLADLVPSSRFGSRQHERGAGPVNRPCAIVLTRNEAKPRRCILFYPLFVFNGTVHQEPALLLEIGASQYAFAADLGNVRFRARRLVGHGVTKHSGGPRRIEFAFVVVVVLVVNDIVVVIDDVGIGQKEASARAAVEPMHEIDASSRLLSDALQDGNVRYLLAPRTRPFAVVTNDRSWFDHHCPVLVLVQELDWGERSHHFC